MPRYKPEQLVMRAGDAASEIALAKASSEAARWKIKHREAVVSAITAERQFNAMISIQGEPSVKKIQKAARSKSSGVAVIVPANDWHVEERIDPEAVSGKNHFNLTEAEKRIYRFYQKVLELIDWQNQLAPVAQLWHPLLGDLMTGYIHEELMETNSLSPTETLIFLRDMITTGIDLWLRDTKLPIFAPCCVGNHGRTTVKKRIKTSCRNSYEWLLYKTLEKQYAKNSRVHFDVAHGYHNVQEIVGRKVRFHHGDAMRYMGGMGGITISVNKAIGQWDRVSPVDLDVFGHFHQFLSHYSKWVACGSLMGYSEFSVAIKAEFQHPTQTFLVVDRNYGLTQATPIFLTKPARLQYA